MQKRHRYEQLEKKKNKRNLWGTIQYSFVPGIIQ